MLKELIKRAYYLKKHLEAPLLEEREYYLRQWADKGAALSSLKSVANYLLRIVEFLQLETASTKVSLERIEQAAKAWAGFQYNHPMKRKYSQTGQQRFIWFCIDWLKQIDRLAPLPEEQEPLFLRLFGRRHALKRYTSAPLLRERLEYLQYWAALNASDSTLRRIAQYQLLIMDLLPFRALRPVYTHEIERVADEWGSNPKVLRRKSSYSKVSKLRFTHDATGWLKMLGCLVEGQEPDFPFQDYRDRYLQYMEQEQGLASETIRGRSFLLKDFLVNLSREISVFEAIAPSIIDGILTLKHERDGLSRPSVQSYASILRSFLRYAEGRHWCAAGMADSIMAPRVYRHDTLPSSPQWTDVQKLLAECRTDNPTDIRDYAIMLLLTVYGLRRSEVAMLTLKDIDWKAEKIYLRRAKRSRPQVFPLAPTVGTAILRYMKQVRPRHCKLEELFVRQRTPIKQTVDVLRSIIGQRSSWEHVFINRLGQPITRFGIHTMVKRYADKLVEKHPGMTGKRVSPHTIRHTTATHLLQAGVDINTIRAWLGHVSVNTTNIYAEVDMEMKARALACCEIEASKTPTHWKNDKDLMSFLENL